MFYEIATMAHGLSYDPFKACVAPRPIGWLTTLSKDGIVNLAPYSFFNAVADDPPMVMFATTGRDVHGPKDTLRNIEATGEFAINLATFDLREQMNASSANVAPHVDEFELAKLTKGMCRLIKAPRVAESPVCLECVLFRVIDLPDDAGKVSDFLIIGRVVGVHIDDRFIEEGRVNTAAMRPIARLGYSEYATVEQAWRMRRPG